MKLRFAGMIDQTKKKPGVFLISVCTLLFVFCGAWASTNAMAASADQVVQAESGTSSTIGALSSTDVTLSWPVPGHSTIAIPYGELDNNVQTGIFISDEAIGGASVVAAEDGIIAKVNAVTSDKGYGAYVIIDHGDGVSTLYAHLDEVLFAEGDPLEKGQVFAKVGSSGFASAPALHFEVREAGVPVDPVGFFIG